jgi:hypothetical protein
MKNFSFLVVASLLIGSSASAVVRPGWERPIMGASLNYIVPTKPVAGPIANFLTLNRRDESQVATSFTLTEDTGIRCVVAPCPSSKTTNFVVVKVTPALRRATVEYHAVEVLTNIPPHVKMAPRRLHVTESQMELVAPGGGGFISNTIWQVRVTSFPNKLHVYEGRPDYLGSIALD